MPRKRNPDTGELYDVPSTIVKTAEPGHDRPAVPAREAVKAAGVPGSRLDDPVGPRGGGPGRYRTGSAPVAPGAGQTGRSSLDAPTELASGTGRAGRSLLDAPTELIRGSRQQTGGARAEGVDPKTRLLRPGRDTGESGRKGSADAATSEGPGAPEAADPMTDPVTGWLVVVAGPGKGRVCRLGHGVNTLGRGGSSRVRIDFGDGGISREGHALLTYDPRGRKYYLQHGGGMNLTYLGKEPVLTPTPLAPMQDISIGETTLRFVPFCGPDFDWQDLEDADGA